jgi:hypothetical protein
LHVFGGSESPSSEGTLPGGADEINSFKEGATMRNQNHSIPPALKRDAQLINSVIRSRKYKRPNAQKHGVFATPVIIPGEDPSEFQELLAELMDEWQPLGPSLRHAVYCLADSMWRVRRLKKSVQTELCQNTFDPRHPAFREEWGFIMFRSRLCTEPETCFEEHARKYLRADKIDYLQHKFPRSNYRSTSEWAEAVINEIDFVLFPSPWGAKAAETAKLGDEFNTAAREWETDQQVKGSIVYARELLEYYDKETERLEARIAKQTKYCAELKALEEMQRNKT